jgi:hypothetical protein
MLDDIYMDQSDKKEQSTNSSKKVAVSDCL